ncbi:acetyltransferase [Nonlabens sp. SY33080]|uniref:acetyltransferase n=1 Tax=Nonlabens sp. SY33080 TaxID=2719911 RepID=UPI0014289D5F|nr:acetyltransferase [Nonlabens sp. SY33080]
MKDIVIIGAGGFGREVKSIIDRINLIKPTYRLLGFYDDNQTLNENINGIPYLGDLNSLINNTNNIDVALGIGDPTVKEKIISRLLVNDTLNFPNIVDPNAIIGNDDITLGIGNIICAGVIITCNIKLKDFITLNLSCTVGHDTIIESFSSFMPSVNISGEVVINKKVYVGTGAKIINLLEIGENTIVGAGAVVAKSLPSNCTAVGIPAKPIKFHNEA